ncbi:hypothetical protein FMUND_3919 [Fusarium mundagurra]|uniref:NACHT domain-containing protein n=1 Tax=Fusarium mundagurra TaxID=1567541 RepID=A0A8H6DKQ2_9HYPO|nr:hypothetical protein FMUND_3919 [Fusarium mundagurra]
MLTGFEALGAASAVLQVISFATDVVVACKNAYDGATTSQDDLQRYAGQMSEAVGRVHTRCEQMSNTNSKFASPELQNIAKECKDAAEKLKTEVSYVTNLQAEGNIVIAIHKAFRVSRHVELQSHLCSRSEAIRLKQESAFQKLDTDVQSLVNQLTKGFIDIQNLVKHEHDTTRSTVAQESTRAEEAINSHVDNQVLELRTAAESKRKCEVFLQSLKAPLMNHRYNDIMDSSEASFNQVYASYENMKTMHHCNSESDESTKDRDGGNAKGHEISKASSYSHHHSLVEHIHQSWASFNLWLQSTDKLFYIQGKPGSGKSTLVKFLRDHEQTNKLLQIWSPDATTLSYFFWKIGSEEQKSIKGLWSSLLYQRLEDQQQLIPSILKRFNYLSRHSGYHDWATKDLQSVWGYLAGLDTRHLCIFIDGLDEIRDADGFSKLLETIDAISIFPEIKLCISTRPEASIVRWLRAKMAPGILLEDLTRFDMLQFVQDRFRQIPPNHQVSMVTSVTLRHKLVNKAQGVFLWLYLATRSIIDGIENMDSDDMLFARLDALPGDLENLYIDLWQRMNAKSPVYVETARRYFRYVLQEAGSRILIANGNDGSRIVLSRPWIAQITCAENPALQEKLLKGTGTIVLPEILQRCEEMTASIRNRCAGFLEVRPDEDSRRLFERLGDISNAFEHVAFIHRTAHDFLTDTEAGRGILGRGPVSDFSSESQLLTGHICTVIFTASEWPLLSYACDPILVEIHFFAQRWGIKSLPLATAMLEGIQPLYDGRFKKRTMFSSAQFFQSFCYLTSEDLFDIVVISHLATDTKTDLANTLLRGEWVPKSDIKLPKGMSKRLFLALIKHGANPHEYGTFDDPRMRPFARKATPFTNLLLESFIFPAPWPQVKIRYFQLPLGEKYTPGRNISSQQMFKRIVSPKPLLRRDIEQLFDMCFEGLLKGSCEPHEDGRAPETIAEYIKDADTEQVDIEDMITSLAAENLGFCTFEEAGITPPHEYLNSTRKGNDWEWKFFPLAMGKLEELAAIKGGANGHE